jgi:hypothetical protein
VQGAVLWALLSACGGALASPLPPGAPHLTDSPIGPVQFAQEGTCTKAALGGKVTFHVSLNSTQPTGLMLGVLIEAYHGAGVYRDVTSNEDLVGTKATTAERVTPTPTPSYLQRYLAYAQSGVVDLQREDGGQARGSVDLEMATHRQPSPPQMRLEGTWSCRIIPFSPPRPTGVVPMPAPSTPPTALHGGRRAGLRRLAGVALVGVRRRGPVPGGRHGGGAGGAGTAGGGRPAPGARTGGGLIPGGPQWTGNGDGAPGVPLSPWARRERNQIVTRGPDSAPATPPPGWDPRPASPFRRRPPV